MMVLGIDFVPLNVPLKTRLEALAAGTWFVLYAGLLPIGIIVTIYLLFFTKVWPIVAAYLFWIWVIDKNVGETGGRSSEWVRSWTLFKYVVNYFPITIKTVPGVQFDPEKNYLCCSFPHGYFPIGTGTAFSTYGCAQAIPILKHHRTHGLTLNSNFSIPIYRDFLLAVGMCSVSRKSIEWLLNYPGGGKMVGLFVGGTAESFLCKANQYRLVLKNRKGFIKVALRNGSPIVPIFAFGQNNTFKLLEFAKDSFGHHFQQLLKRVTGIAFPAIYGRGLFQYTFGLIPLQKPINLVVGAPIDVPRVENPSQEEIDSLHQKFIDALSNIFNEYKHECEENPEACTLEIC